MRSKGFVYTFCCCRSTLEQTREKQKLREKPKGISVAELAIGKKITIEDEVTSVSKKRRGSRIVPDTRSLCDFQKDVFNSKGGGMVNMQAVKSGKFKQTNDDAYDTGIGTQFSAETNKRDEDEEMMKYIEEQLQAKKGEDSAEADEDARKYMTPEDAALYSIPEHLRQSSTHRYRPALGHRLLR